MRQPTERLPKSAAAFERRVVEFFENLRVYTYLLKKLDDEVLLLMRDNPQKDRKRINNPIPKRWKLDLYQY